MFASILHVYNIEKVTEDAIVEEFSTGLISYVVILVTSSYCSPRPLQLPEKPSLSVHAEESRCSGYDRLREIPMIWRDSAS